MNERDVVKLLQSIIQTSRTTVGKPPITGTSESIDIVIESCLLSLRKLRKAQEHKDWNQADQVSAELITTVISYYSSIQYWLALNMKDASPPTTPMRSLN